MKVNPHPCHVLFRDSIFQCPLRCSLGVAMENTKLAPRLPDDGLKLHLPEGCEDW